VIQSTSRAEDPSLSQKAMEMAQENLAAERSRAQRAEDHARSASQFDGNMIAQFTRPFELQIQAQTAQTQALQQQVADLIKEINNKKENSSDVFGRIVENNDSRLMAIKEQHASELRTLRERHDAEVTRLRDNNEQERRRLEDRLNNDLAQRDRTHEAEIRRIEKTHESEKLMFQHAIGSKEEVLRGRIADLDRSLTETKAEIGHLRAIKEKSPIENMKEMAEFKAAVEDLTGGGGEKEEGIGTQIIGAIGPLVEAFSSRVQNAQVQQAAAPQQQQRPQQQMRRRRNVIPIQQHPGQGGQVQQVQQQQPQQQPQQQVPQQQIIELNASEVQTAVLFLESAVANGTDPATFAGSARTMVPGDILSAIEAYGIERFLVEVARVPDSSNLLTIAGRKFLKKVAQILAGQQLANSQPPAPQAPMPA